MNWSTGLSWLAALKARRAARSGDDDRGDMGTAFGLDASMAPGDDGRAAGRHSLPPPSATPWEHRLTRRSSL